MEEQQTPAAEATEQTTKGEEIVSPSPVKYNRKARRALMAFDKKNAKLADASSRRRLKHFNTLNDWKSKALQGDKLSLDHIGSVYRVSLNKLFKKDFSKPGEFEAQLKAIVKNVKKGFKYKADILPAPATGAAVSADQEALAE